MRSKKFYKITSLTLLSAVLTSSVIFSNHAVADSQFLAKSSPVSISIPAIKVTSKFIPLGLDSDGALEVPANGSVAGWYTGAPTPGELGPAIVAAHVDMGGKPGVFFNLKLLKVGDRISIKRADGKTVNFAVYSVASVLKSSFPTSKVYGDINFSGLRLITCGGKFDPKIGHYLSNIIVFAKKI